MILVAATLGDDVDGAPHRESKLRGEAVPVNLVLLDGINRDEHPVLPRTVFILAPVNRGEVVTPVAAPDRIPGRAEAGEPGLLSSSGLRVSDGGQRVNRRGHVAVDIGQALHLTLLNGVGLLCTLNLDQRRRGSYDHFGFDARHLQLDFISSSLADGELNLFYQVLREASRFNRNLVIAGSHQADLKLTVRIGSRSADRALIKVLNAEIVIVRKTLSVNRIRSRWCFICHPPKLAAVIVTIRRVIVGQTLVCPSRELWTD